MCRLITSLIRNPSFKPLRPPPPGIRVHVKPYDIVINHRGVDTKEKEAGLIYDYLRWRGFRPFLDAESLKPGEKYPDVIDEAICGCKVGILVFSPRYGESLSCLNELVQLMETGKALLPIFCNIEPSELRVAEYRLRRSSAEQAKKFEDALGEAKRIVGLRFKSDTGNWAKLGRETVKEVERMFMECGDDCNDTSISADQN